MSDIRKELERLLELQVHIEYWKQRWARDSGTYRAETSWKTLQGYTKDRDELRQQIIDTYNQARHWAAVWKKAAKHERFQRRAYGAMIEQQEVESEILNKENKRLCAANHLQAAEIARLREALERIVDGINDEWSPLFHTGDRMTGEEQFALQEAEAALKGPADE